MDINVGELNRKFMDEGFLIEPSLLKQLPEDFNFNHFIELMDVKFKKRPLILNEGVVDFILNSNKESSIEINWGGFDEASVIKQKGHRSEIYDGFFRIMDYGSDSSSKKVGKLLESVGKDDVGLEDVEKIIEPSGLVCDDSLIVLEPYVDEWKEKTIQDFVNYFKSRYNLLKGMLSNRQNLQDVTSINRVQNKFEKGNVGIIGLVNEKRITKNGNIILGLEDPTGRINVLINKNRKELFNVGKDILLDEVIGINGVCDPGFGKGKIIFCDELVCPGIPMDHEFKKLDKDIYAVFTGDLHLGNKLFYGKDFLKFIDWINGELGSKEQKEVAKKVKYLFVVGDLVEGVGIYPNQDEDLDIKDVYEQYSLFAEMIEKIRKDVKIVLIGGNHDAMRIAEPQPFLDKKIAAPLYELPNVVMANNPCTINICSSSNFDGFNILLYHGYSFPYLAEHIEDIRMNGAVTRPDLVMKAILKRRHLAPPHNSTLYIPDGRNDPLVIKKVPDFFVTGHIHKTFAGNYKNISIIGAGCWVGQTENMKKRGLEPDPSRVILTNLQTREMKLLYFGD